MSHDLLTVLRQYTHHTIGWVCQRLSGDLQKELASFMRTYPSSANQSAIFFLPEFNMSDNLVLALRNGGRKSIVEVMVDLRLQENREVIDELSEFLEAFPGCGTHSAEELMKSLT